MNNLELWNKVCTTDPKDTKRAKLGQMEITAICPQSQRQKATEIFGPFGLGWGIKDEQYSFMDIGDTKLCTYRALLWYKYDKNEGVLPITGNIKVAFVTNAGKGYLKIDDEYSKKVSTDALTKGLSTLGFNADIFLGKYDDNKYVQSLKNDKAIAEQNKIHGLLGELQDLARKLKYSKKMYNSLGVVDTWKEDDYKSCINYLKSQLSKPATETK